MGVKKWQFLTESMLSYIDTICDEMLSGQSSNTIKQYKNVVKKTYEKLQHDPRTLFEGSAEELADLFNNTIRATKIPTEAHIQASAHKITQFYESVIEHLIEEKKSQAQRELENYLQTTEGQNAMLSVFKQRAKQTNPNITKDELDSLVLPIQVQSKKRKAPEPQIVKPLEVEESEVEEEEEEEGSDEEAQKVFAETVTKKPRK